MAVVFEQNGGSGPGYYNSETGYFYGPERPLDPTLALTGNGTRVTDPSDVTQQLIQRYGLDAIITNGTAGGNNGAYRTVGNDLYLDLPTGGSVLVSTVAANTIVAADRVQNTQPPAPGIETAYAQYWDTVKVGTYTDFAGGVLYRYSNNNAVFIDKSGKEYTLARNSKLDDIASIVPAIANVWRAEFGFEPSNPSLATQVVDVNNWNPIYGAYADANRDPYATRYSFAFDKDIRAINVSGLSPQMAWNKIALVLFAGKGMTIADIGRIGDAVGGVGNYLQAADGTYYLPESTIAEVVATANTVNAPTPVASNVNFVAGPVNNVVADAVTGAALVTNAGAIGTNLVNTATGTVNGVVNGATGAITNTVNSATAVATAAIAGFASAAAAASTAQSLLANAVKLPEALPSSLSPFVSAISSAAGTVSSSITQIENLFSGQASTLLKAKNQATLAARYNQATTNDWRVRLSLAPNSQYLYKIDTTGILGPLFDTNGVIFPYMPSIETSYAANYDKYDLTHSNYRGYFYKGSAVNDVNIRATFTAQDTQEANYLLAVIHFFRSVTKMFYGQDAERGAPPPLVFLTGLGEHQFNNHPCLVANFSYSLPNDVDYIRARAPNNYGNLFSQRQRTGSIAASAGLGTVATRLLNNALTAGAQPAAPTTTYLNNNVNNLDKASYVPTKIELNITLLPTNTRAQVSQQFSVKEFANGNLIKGGFW